MQFLHIPGQKQNLRHLHVGRASECITDCEWRTSVHEYVSEPLDLEIRECVKRMTGQLTDLLVNHSASM